MFRCALLSFVVLAAPVGAAPRNVLFIVADDLGMQVGCYGDKHAKTPHIDALAARGTRFANAFASVSSCSPSRATLLTGLPTHACGQYGLAHGDHNAHSFRTVRGLPALLAGKGYKSGVVAKLHVQPKEVYPFDEEIRDGGRNPVTIAEKAKAFIRGCGEKPFFLLVGFTDPHHAAKGFANEAKYPAGVPTAKFDPDALPLPYHLPNQPEARADWADYYQAVARMDHGVGLLMNVLAETNVAGETLVVFLSDNGVPFPGAKTTLYDAGVHLPMLMYVPGQTANVSATMASYTDVTPTILDWAGVAKPANLPGRSLLKADADVPAVFGSHQFHEVTMYYPMRMIRTRTHKLIVNYAHPLEYPSASDLWDSPTWQGILRRKDTMLGTRPMSAFLHRPKLELYDLKADPDELKNLAADPTQAGTVAWLRGDLLAWQRQTKDPWLVKEQHE